MIVGNIPYDATEEQLIQICEEVGPVVSFRSVWEYFFIEKRWGLFSTIAIIFDFLIALYNC